MRLVHLFTIGTLIIILFSVLKLFRLKSTTDFKLNNQIHLYIHIYYMHTHKYILRILLAQYNRILINLPHWKSIRIFQLLCNY